MEFNEALRTHFKFKRSPGGISWPRVVIWRPARKQGEIPGPMGLAAMARDMDARTGVEIGTYLGKWASLWCRTNPKLQLTCIDPYVPYGGRASEDTQEECYQTALRTLKPYNATIMREASLDVVDSFEDESLDFVSIDGDHFFDAVMQDLIRWPRKVRKGGMVLIHDYTSSQGCGVMRAVDAYTHCHNISPWYVTMDYTPTAFWERGVETA